MSAERDTLVRKIGLRYAPALADALVTSGVSLPDAQLFIANLAAVLDSDEVTSGLMPADLTPIQRGVPPALADEAIRLVKARVAEVLLLRTEKKGPRSVS